MKRILKRTAGYRSKHHITAHFWKHSSFPDRSRSDERNVSGHWDSDLSRLGVGNADPDHLHDRSGGDTAFAVDKSHFHKHFEYDLP